MADFNKVFLLGNLGSELELKKSASGYPYLSMSVATHSFRSENRNADDASTNWHKVVVFGAQAEACAKYLTKGASIFIEGYLEVTVYTDADDRKRSSVSVVAHNVQFLSGKRSGLERDLEQEFSGSPKTKKDYSQVS